MTYSIVGRDPVAEEIGIAVQSRHFSAGRLVPWVEPGVGVVASQSFVNPVYGRDGLRLLRAGHEPEQVLGRLLAEDDGAAMRQVAILDAKGGMAVHTGSRCVAAAGHAIGAGCCAQANMMARDTVWPAMVHAFENGSGALADRLLAALEAAESEGGDIRGRQAASLVVVSARASAVSRPDRHVDLRVDDHPDPVGEIRRLLACSRVQRRADKAIERALASDFQGALGELEACSAAYPDEPAFLFRRVLVLLPLGRTDEARAVLEKAEALHHGWAELLLRFADAGVIAAGREAIEPLVASVVASRPKAS